MPIAYDIQWDTDGDEELAESLPREIEIPDGMTDGDEISGFLSDTTGFCHFGFRLKDMDGHNQATVTPVDAQYLSWNDMEAFNAAFQAKYRNTVFLPAFCMTDGLAHLRLNFYYPDGTADDFRKTFAKYGDDDGYEFDVDGDRRVVLHHDMAVAVINELAPDVLTDNRAPYADAKVSEDGVTLIPGN